MSTRPADVLRIALAIACMGWLVQASLVQAQTHPLNDTGITWSGHATGGNAATCDASHPAGQDCHYGRDAQAAVGQLTKKGGGNAGFDFTKISNSGIELPANAVLGNGPSDWACTKDNVTGLIWEVKTTSGLRSKSHTYTWFNTHSPDGNKGTSSGFYASCHQSGRCDTEKYTADVNAASLCGASDWRMPTVVELLSIVDFSRSSNVSWHLNVDYFPNSSPGYWTALPSLFSFSGAGAWALNDGRIMPNSRVGNNYVRLVRDGM